MSSRGKSRVTIEEEGFVKLTRPTLIVGVPEVGLVGTIASSYIIQQLGLPEIAYVSSDLTPQVIVVHDSAPKHPIRIYGKGELAVIIAETPLTPRLAYELSDQLMTWSKEHDAKMIVGITGIPSKDREGSEKDKSSVFAVSNDAKLIGKMKQAGAQVFEEGLMAGTYATLLEHCMSSGTPNLTLLAESHIQFPDPGAAASVIEVLANLLDLKVDIGPLLSESEEIRVKSRELMSATQAVQQGTQGTPGVYT